MLVSVRFFNHSAYSFYRRAEYIKPNAAKQSKINSNKTKRNERRKKKTIQTQPSDPSWWFNDEMIGEKKKFHSQPHYAIAVNAFYYRDGRDELCIVAQLIKKRQRVVANRFHFTRSDRFVSPLNFGINSIHRAIESQTQTFAAFDWKSSQANIFDFRTHWIVDGDAFLWLLFVVLHHIWNKWHVRSHILRAHQKSKNLPSLRTFDVVCICCCLSPYIYVE